MKSLKFKTTLKCDGCLSKVTPSLNKLVGEGNWNVDLQNTPKILTVTTEVSEKEIEKAFQENGFQAEKI